MNEMRLAEDYFNRLLALADIARSRGHAGSSGSVLETLREDVDGPCKLFSAEEYRDPTLRKLILMFLGALLGNTGMYFAPPEVTRLVRRLLDTQSVLSLYSGVGDFLFEFESGIGVEPNPTAAEWAGFFAKIAGGDFSIINGDPLSWTTSNQFDSVVCNAPFGVKSKDKEEDIFVKALSLVREGGRLAAIVPPNVLGGQRQEKLRKTISELAHVSAVISLPAGSRNDTAIHSAVLVLAKAKRGKTYMATSKSPADLEAIADDYWIWRSDGKSSVGFWVDADVETWSPGYYEPIDFGVGDAKFPYSVVSLGEVANVVAATPSPEAKVAINRTGSKTVWVADEPGLIARNNLFLAPSPRLNASYLHLYLNSAMGRRAIAKCIKGGTIPHISASDAMKVPVILPQPEVQAQLVTDALEIRRSVSELQSLADEGRQALAENLFSLGGVRDKFRVFAAGTETAFYQRLPFPVAVIYRKLANAPNSTQRFSLMLELFEVAIRFVVLVQIADYASREPAILASSIPGLRKLYAPAVGDWVGMFRTFVKLKASPESVPFLKEIPGFEIGRYERTLNEISALRNASLRGHGGTLTEDEYDRLFQEHAPRVYDLISALRFLANYELVKATAMDKEGSFYKIPVQILMGDNPHFEQGCKVLRTPLETKRVLYLNSSDESVVLDPYIVLEYCPECKRPELLVLDKVSGKKITYHGYESGHRPSFEYSERLPSAVRQLAEQRPERPMAESEA
jgi:hypothetical protein